MIRVEMIPKEDQDLATTTIITIITEEVHPEEETITTRIIIVGVGTESDEGKVSDLTHHQRTMN
jgi:hypothetical protein